MGTKHPISEGASMWLHVTFSFTEDTDVHFLSSFFIFIATCPVACLPLAGGRKMCSISFFCTPLKK